MKTGGKELAGRPWSPRPPTSCCWVRPAWARPICREAATAFLTLVSARYDRGCACQSYWFSGFSPDHQLQGRTTRSTANAEERQVRHPLQRHEARARTRAHRQQLRAYRLPVTAAPTLLQAPGSPAKTGAMTAPCRRPTLTTITTRTGCRAHRDIPGICTRFGSTRRLNSGRTPLDMTNSQSDDPTLYIESVHEVHALTPQRNQEPWMRHVNALTGAVTVDDYPGSIWATDELAGPPTPRRRANDPTDMLVDELVNTTLELRAADRDFSDCRALATALPTVRQCVANQLILHPDDTPDLALHPATEVLDRAYNSARVQRAGIPFDDHPQLHRYQYFHDLDLPPPTHQQMADHIVRPGAACRVLNTLLRTIRQAARMLPQTRCRPRPSGPLQPPPTPLLSVQTSTSMSP